MRNTRYKRLLSSGCGCADSESRPATIIKYLIISNMLVSEFIDRTGYQPTAEEYADIERAYMRFAGNMYPVREAFRDENHENFRCSSEVGLQVYF